MQSIEYEIINQIIGNNQLDHCHAKYKVQIYTARRKHSYHQAYSTIKTHVFVKITVK